MYGLAITAALPSSGRCMPPPALQACTHGLPGLCSELLREVVKLSELLSQASTIRYCKTARDLSVLLPFASRSRKPLCMKDTEKCL